MYLCQSLAGCSGDAVCEYSQKQSGIRPKSDWRMLPFLEHLANGYAPVLPGLKFTILRNLSSCLWGLPLKMLLGEKKQQLLLRPLLARASVRRSILALLEARQPLEALAAMRPCCWQGGARCLAPLQAGLFRISAVAFLQVMLSHEPG